MKLDLTKVTDEELLDIYRKGTKWLTSHMQVTGSTKNSLGEELTPKSIKLWEAGLKKIELVEKEMNKRDLAI